MKAAEAEGGAAEAAKVRPGLPARLLSRKAGLMLVRNTVVSCAVFALNLVLLWLQVETMGVAKLPAAALAFIAANSIHYVFGRTWIFRGTERGIGAGYAYFFVNAGIGLAITLVLFAAMLRFTPFHYLVSRVIVSVFAGLAMFVLNATLNFRRL